MKETTRQLILLIGILTMLTGGLVTMNIARSNSPDTQPDQQNQQQVKDPQNTTEPVNDTKSNETSDEKKQEEPEGIIGKSIRGFEIMYRDIRVAMGAVSGKSAQAP